jgi:hypothetical protein
MAKPQYRLVVGKGGSIYRGSADNIAGDLDDWMNEALGHRITAEIDWRKYRDRLTTALTSLYTEGVTTAINHWIGTASTPSGAFVTPADVNIENDRMSDIVDRFDANHDFIKKKLNPRGGLGAASVLGTTQNVHWHPLTKRTLSAKTDHFNGVAMANRGKSGKVNLDKVRAEARKFYVFSGRMKAELMAKRRAMVKRTGVVRIAGVNLRQGKKAIKLTKVRGQTVPIAKLRVRLLPNIATSSLPGITSGDWRDDTGDVGFESALGLSAETVKKLGNIRGGEPLGKRPMLQPIFTYYTLFRAPQVIGAVADNMLAQAVNKAARRMG